MASFRTYKKHLTVLGYWLILVSALVAYPAHSSAGGQMITAWSYYFFPPFITEENQGFAYEFVDLLNEHAQDRFTFQLKNLPRKRIDFHLAEKEQGIVLFVNPTWMGVNSQTLYEWTPSLFADRNVIVSHMSKKVDFTDPKSVAGMKLGGILGRKYKKLDKLVDAGVLHRENAKNEKSNIMKLSEQRIDFMTAPETMLRSLVTRLNIQDRIYFSPIPLFEYTRHILLSNPSPELSEFLMQFVRELPQNPKWTILKAKYSLRDQLKMTD